MQDIKQRHQTELDQLDAQMYRAQQRRHELLAILATIEALEKKAKPAGDAEPPAPPEPPQPSK